MSEQCQNGYRSVSKFRNGFFKFNGFKSDYRNIILTMWPWSVLITIKNRFNCSKHLTSCRSPLQNGVRLLGLAHKVDRGWTSASERREIRKLKVQNVARIEGLTRPRIIMSVRQVWKRIGLCRMSFCFQSYPTSESGAFHHGGVEGARLWRVSNSGRWISTGWMSCYELSSVLCFAE